MDTHVCKQCGSHFVYCRACVFRPIKYKDLGFCSKECYETSKIEPIKDEVVTETHIETKVDSIEGVQPIVEETNLENAETSTEKAIAEISVVEPIMKQETYNTYKKKKNKYKYTSSL